MKQVLQLKPLIVIFFLLDVSLFAIVVILFFKTNQVRVVTLDENNISYSLPYLTSQTQKNINIASHAFIIYDPETRAVIGGKNERLRFSPASTAKIMAATIVLANYSLDTILTAKNVGSVEGSKMDLVEGEQISVRNLLYGMMLPSGNDAAFVLAENFPGGIDGFVAAMNKKAQSLDMENTNFTDPDGYDDNNYTTAYDLARLAAYAMKNPTFAKIVGTKFITVYDTNGRIRHDLGNLNELLGIDGVTGVKTGFTNEAEGVLVTSIIQQDREYIIVVLGSIDRFADTKNVIDEAIQKIHVLTY